MNTVQKVIDGVSRSCARAGEWVLLVCMTGMSVVICMQVFARYILHNSIPWSEELARFLMIWLGLVGASVVLRNDNHVAITIIQDRLHPKLSAAIALLGRIAIGIFISVLIKEGFQLAMFFKSQKSPAMRVSMLLPYASLFIAGVFMAVHWLNLVLADILKLRRTTIRPQPGCPSE